MPGETGANSSPETVTSGISEPGCDAERMRPVNRTAGHLPHTGHAEGGPIPGFGQVFGTFGTFGRTVEGVTGTTPRVPRTARPSALGSFLLPEGFEAPSAAAVLREGSLLPE